MRGAPDRRSPHFSTITTSHWLPPQASRYIPPPRPYPTFDSSNPSCFPPTTLCPDSLPPGPFQWHSLSTTPCQPRLPFRFPVHRLHWSRHSLSLAVPLPSVIRPPDQCRPRTPYPLRVLPPPPTPTPPPTPHPQPQPPHPHPPPPTPTPTPLKLKILDQCQWFLQGIHVITLL